MVLFVCDLDALAESAFLILGDLPAVRGLKLEYLIFVRSLSFGFLIFVVYHAWQSELMWPHSSWIGVNGNLVDAQSNDHAWKDDDPELIRTPPHSKAPIHSIAHVQSRWNNKNAKLSPDPHTMKQTKRLLARRLIHDFRISHRFYRDAIYSCEECTSSIHVLI